MLFMFLMFYALRFYVLFFNPRQSCISLRTKALCNVAQSAGAVEYTDITSAER